MTLNKSITLAGFSAQVVRIDLIFTFAVIAVFCLVPGARGALVLSSVNTPVTQSFDSLGAGTNLSVLDSAGWRISNAANSNNFAVGLTSLDFVQAATFADNPSGGSYNFQNSTLTSDRAAGFLLTGNFDTSRNLMLLLTNHTGQAVTQLALSFDYEKYRTGTRAFNMAFFHGADGATWTENSVGAQSYPANPSNAGLETPTTISKLFSLTGLNIANGSSYYLRWNLSGVGSGNSSNGQAIGLDNLSITSVAVPEPAAILLVGIVSGMIGLTLTARKLLTRRAP